MFHQEDSGTNHNENRGTYIDILSSLIMYPMPNPSCATGPKPNNLNAGLPQLDVERMLVFNTVHPGSTNIEGSVCLLGGGDRRELDSSEDEGSEFISWIPR